MRMKRGAEETKLMEKHFDQFNVLFWRKFSPSLICLISAVGSCLLFCPVEKNTNRSDSTPPL